MAHTPENLPENESLQGLRCVKSCFKLGAIRAVLIPKMSLFKFVQVIIISTGLSGF